MKRCRLQLFFLLLLSLLILPACGGYQSLSSIIARDEISGQSFTARLFVRRGEPGGSFTSFASSSSLTELAEKIAERAENTGDLQSAVYQEQYVLFTQKNGGETACFLLARVPDAEGDEQPRYALFAPVASFGQMEMGDGASYVYFPYHLVQNTEIQMYPGQSVIPDGAAYPAVAGPEAFEAFYQSLSACETQREGGVLKVDHIKSGKTIRLTFYEEQGTEMVRFSADPPMES